MAILGFYVESKACTSSVDEKPTLRNHNNIQQPHNKTFSASFVLTEHILNVNILKHTRTSMTFFATGRSISSFSFITRGWPDDQEWAREWPRMISELGRLEKGRNFEDGHFGPWLHSMEPSEKFETIKFKLINLKILMGRYED